VKKRSNGVILGLRGILDKRGRNKRKVENIS
jgi:hypothetical protein